MIWVAAGKLAKWLFKHPDILLIAALSLGMGILSAKLASTRAELADQRTITAEAESQVKLQNAMIGFWKEVADEKAKAAAAALAVADAVASGHATTATTILTRPVPTPDQECAATLDLLREYQR